MGGKITDKINIFLMNETTSVNELTNCACMVVYFSQENGRL